MSAEKSEANKWHPPLGVIKESKRQSPWGPTPIRPTDPRIQTQQRFVRRQAETIFDNHVPDFISPEFLEFMKLSYFSREATRATKNMSSFISRLVNLSDITDPEILAVIERMYLGHVTPSETMDGADALQLSSTEIAKLGVYFGYRLEHRAPMMNEITQAVVDKGGVVYDTPKETFEILMPDTGVTGMDRLSIGIMMARQLDFAELGDNRFFVRDSFNVRLDDGSEIDPKVTSRLKSLNLADLSRQQMNGIEMWKRVALDTTYLKENVTELLAADDHETIVRQSITVVEHNPTVRKKVKKHWHDQVYD
jgi:hypothetical protein